MKVKGKTERILLTLIFISTITYIFVHFGIFIYNSQDSTSTDRVWVLLIVLAIVITNIFAFVMKVLRGKNED
ncbi:hypothetical protein LCGC14_0692180 [marine sediment metagenome]|uniref:Uncharacterized protein n=1 Tax=marine sediment metagenome TaxID=412755 RepID=A0A0F9TT36_9ZZZZ